MTERRFATTNTIDDPPSSEGGPQGGLHVHQIRRAVTVGRDADLNKAMDDAAWAMIDLLEKDKGLTRLDAYSLASMVMDCRLAAPVGSQKAVHCLVPKSTWVASR